MRRLLILFSLAVVLFALVLRKVNADRVLRQSRRVKLSGTAQELARKMLDSLDYSDVKIEVTSRETAPWAGMDCKAGEWLRMPSHLANAHSASSHGRAALLIGLFVLAQRDGKVISARMWALRFGHVFPIFTLIVLVFAVLMAKLFLGWALAVLLGVMALATLVQCLTLRAERQAAELAAVVLEKKRIIARQEDEDAVMAALRGWSWAGVLPGILARIA